MYKKTYLKISIPLMFSLLLIKTKRTSKAKIKRSADTGSPWRVPFPMEYGVVLPPSITRDF